MLQWQSLWSNVCHQSQSPSPRFYFILFLWIFQLEIPNIEILERWFRSAISHLIWQYSFLDISPLWSNSLMYLVWPDADVNIVTDRDEFEILWLSLFNLGNLIVASTIFFHAVSWYGFIIMENLHWSCFCAKLFSQDYCIVIGIVFHWG